MIFLIRVNILIKSSRKRQNLTQKELSLRCNLSQSYLSKLENKKYSNVTIEQVIILSKELKINPMELANWFIYIHLEQRNMNRGNIFEGSNISEKI